MARLLYIESSPRKSRSASIEVAHAFLDGYRAAHPGDKIDVLDIWNENIPALDQNAFEAKYAGLAGQQRSEAQEIAWQELKAYADRIRAADKILIGVPMWNFAIPYRLKQLIDAVSHKDLLFTFDDRGLNGLCTNAKAYVIYARGIGYGPETGFPLEVWDQQKPYMDLWLKFIGVPSVSSLIVEKTLFGEDRAGVLAKAKEAGRAF